MTRLESLPVPVVHGGHEDSFGQERLIEIGVQYPEAWQARMMNSHTTYST
ncbi:MAG: hypothetical protein KJO31_13200 [Gammaproteobacteria bacterium]|nr:hypothetical protein [Gammaproteobacteria bacterium]